MKAQLIAVILVSVVFAQAHNNFFLPGDAFFATAFSEEQIARLKEKHPREIVLDYQRLDNRFMACGSIGYSTLKLTDVDEPFLVNLVAAYEWVRKMEITHFVKTERNGQETLIEWNPVVALVYTKGQVAYPLGLKFNEHWKQQGAGVYGGFLDDGWSVMQDWKRGEKIAPLSLTTPLAPMAHLSQQAEVHRTMDTVLTLKASQAEIVFVGLLKKNSWVHNECLNLKSLSAHENWRTAAKADAFYLRVTSEKMSLSQYSPGETKKELLKNERGDWVEREKQ